MNKIAIVTTTPQEWKQIRKKCEKEDFLFCWFSQEEIEKELAKSKVQLIILDLEEITTILQWFHAHESTRDIPLLWVLPRRKMHLVKPGHKVSDLVFSPVDTDELICRIRRILCRSQNVDDSQVIEAQGLSVDFVKYEVRLEGEMVNLTYKEYELLKFLAANKGKVFTREILLNKVWGYEYFGGTRTVDVHIRRLRSKIEDAHHTYIDTVRNIGYRFKE